MTDDGGLARRLKGGHLVRTVGWKRMVGGKFGAFVDLPSGCYSDDTQLRLATSRCIRADGHFDVEAFAKVELPVWLAYALGAGAASKSAAEALASRNTTWFNNFFSRARSQYINSGGNGAAMRIQPHVWARASSSDTLGLVRDVVRNSICSHGHIRGIAGAVVHALALQHALLTNEIPGPDIWEEIVSDLATIGAAVGHDPELSAFWLPHWEHETKASLPAAIRSVQDELRRDLRIVRKSLDASDATASYARSAQDLGALEPSSRGSGTKTALLSLLSCWLFRMDGPNSAIVSVSGLVGSDTDSIATMVGAVMGAVAIEEPGETLADREYIETEAVRLADIAGGKTTSSFMYPDPLVWIAPKNALDCVGTWSGEPYLAGLGRLEFSGEPVGSKSAKDESVWQWARLDFGQRVLCKRRRKLRPLPEESRPQSEEVRMEIRVNEQQLRAYENDRRSLDLFSETRTVEVAPAGSKTLDQLTDEAIKSGFDPAVIGQHLLELAQRDGEIELGIAYVSILLKARKARIKNKR
ncbi:ADP-ribosylglycohydrolase family protein [Usitatibacter palustris]